MRQHIEQRGFKAFGDSIKAVLADERVDGVILLPFASRMIEYFPFEEIGEAVRESGKAMVSWMFGDLRYFDTMEERLRGFGIPVYNDLHSCVLAMKSYLCFSRKARGRAAGE